MRRINYYLQYNVYWCIVIIDPVPFEKVSFSLQEKSKAVLEVGSVCKVAAILFFTITVIFIFTFRKCRMNYVS